SSPHHLALTSFPTRRSSDLLMGEGSPEVAAIAQWEYDGEVPSTAELVRGLEVTFRAWQECLERWTPEDLEYIFKGERRGEPYELDRKSTRLNSSHEWISYAV